MKRLAICCALVAAAACGPEPVGLQQPGAVKLEQPPPAPGFAVLPALDRRPRAERDGESPGITLRFATAGAGIFWWSGADVRADDKLIWERNSFRGMNPSAATMLSTDLGTVLAETTNRPTDFWPISPTDIIKTAASTRVPDGTVVVLPVIDHIAEVKPSTKQSSAASYDTATHHVTETHRSSQTLGKTWTVMVRLHVYQLQGGQISRHLVRYAAASGGRDAYVRALQLAALQIAHVSSTYFSLPQ